MSRKQNRWGVLHVFFLFHVSFVHRPNFPELRDTRIPRTIYANFSYVYVPVMTPTCWWWRRQMEVGGGGIAYKSFFDVILFSWNSANHLDTLQTPCQGMESIPLKSLISFEFRLPGNFNIYLKQFCGIIMSGTPGCTRQARRGLRLLYLSLGMRQLFGDITVGQWRHNRQTWLSDLFSYFS